MKKLGMSLALASLALLLPSLATAQKNVIKFDLGSTPAGQYSLAYERALGGRFSAQLAAGIISKDSWQVFTDGAALTRYTSDTKGLIAVPEMRFYLRKDAPRGLYLNGYGRFRTATRTLQDQSIPMETDVSFREKTVTMGGGAALGVHFLILRTLSIDMNVGPQFKDRSITRDYVTEGVTDEDFNTKFLDLKLGDKQGMAIRAQFTLGVAF